MIKFVQTPNPTKPWRGPRLHRRDAQRVEAGERWGIAALGLDCSGDPCFSHFLKQNGEDNLALPNETFYPLLSKDLWKLHSPEVLTEDIESEGVYSVHFFATQKRIYTEIWADYPPQDHIWKGYASCLLYTSPSPRDLSTSRMPSSA